jgi:hypothetical protein
VVWPSTVASWGTTAPERAERFPCDRLIPNPDHVTYCSEQLDQVRSRIVVKLIVGYPRAPHGLLLRPLGLAEGQTAGG